MITVDPEFVGSLAPPSKLTTETTFDATKEIPFARLPRVERLKVSGKADETEVASKGEDALDSSGKKLSKEKREQKKQHGKGQSQEVSDEDSLSFRFSRVF